MVMEKPLPDIPAPTVRPNQLRPSSNLTVLTVEAHDHLRRFLSQLLEDEDYSANREEWVHAFEAALRELGECISIGGWLAGLKRARMLRKELQKLTGRRESTESVKSSTVQGSDAREKVDGDRAANCVPSTADQGHKELGKSHLESLRVLIAKPTSPSPKPRVRHLLLTVTPHGSEDSEYGGSNVGCRFTSGKFSLPPSASDNDIEGILYGFDEWNGSLADEGTLQIIGGTFSFTGLTTPTQRASFTKILRVSLFVYLSLLLEQHVLSNSHVALRFRKPSTSTTHASPSVQRALSSSQLGGKLKRDSGSGFWSFLARKTDSILHRAVDATPSLVRRGSLDLPTARSLLHPEENPIRPRRISLISDLRPSFMLPQKEEPQEDPPFALAVALLKTYEDIYSTSPGVAFSPPALLTRLAEKEKQDSERRLTGDERAALTSLLGWTSKADKGQGMAGIAGFVRQQGLCTLYAEHTPSCMSMTSRPATPGSHRTSPLSSITPATTPKSSRCGNRKRWITYRYWSRDLAQDECLGEAVVRMCGTANDPCQEQGCQYKRGEHELQWIHAGTRIVAKITSNPEVKSDERTDDALEMWESCQICGKESKKKPMLDGTYLFSFAKYLELLSYSPAIFQLMSPPCDHTTAPPRPWTDADTPLPKMRTHIVRNFCSKERQVSFTLSIVEDIFEIAVPRLQIVRGKSTERNEEASDDGVRPLEGARRALRREIMKWWQGLSEHMDELEGNFVTDHTGPYHKALPRLPSLDDAYDLLEDVDDAVTPKGRISPLPPHPPNTPQTPRAPSSSTVSHSVLNKDPEEAPETTSLISTASSVSSSEATSLQLLSNLRHSFQRTEQNLYTELSETPEASLNDVRRSFQTAAKGATRRLAAWQTKHMATALKANELSADTEPEWWGPECHAVPGSNVIVRDNDWGSIIAFTLSSRDYHHELANMSSNRSVIIPPVPPSTPAVTRPSFFSKGKWLTSSAPQPDPDQDDVVWQEPETYSAVISRKEHPRDPTSLLTMAIPDVLRKTPVDLSSISAASKFASLGSTSGKGIMPPSAWAKPEVQISKEAADAHLSGASAEGVGKIISGLEAVSDHSRSRRNSESESHASASTFFETNIRRGKASSIMSTDSDAATIGPSGSNNHSAMPPPVPPKNSELSAATPDGEYTPPTESAISGKGASMTESLTTTLSAALRYMVKGGESPPLPQKHHHGLLSAGSPAIDDRPHIKYDWTIGKRLKFSCTVYYAKQFDSLRRRCGIEDIYLRSLARSENWMAEGGKSKSNFWRTSDNQFIIKTLVNAWNVADLQVLIDLGPSYFRYMDATASRATVFAKLLGFYTVEIRNLESGNVQAKADLLVMENVFYNQNISKTFDLKGIQGRKVKASSDNDKAESKTLFDGEWIEGQQRALTLVHPHSKAILTEAIKADCEFLAKSNVMDYSLLLGICEERKVIACGLVDAIGSYTFAKTLEYKAKQGLNSGKEVTVVPPAEYQERFVNALDGYFLACPDKWSRPLDDTSVPGDYRKLPSVL